MKTAEEILKEKLKGVEGLTRFRVAILEAMKFYAKSTSATDKARIGAMIPFTVAGWTVSFEDEPWAEKMHGSKFKAVDDEGTVKSAPTLGELVRNIFEETEDYFWKSEETSKARIEELQFAKDSLEGSVLAYDAKIEALEKENEKLRELMYTPGDQPERNVDKREEIVALEKKIEALEKENDVLKEKMGVEHCPSLPDCHKASQENTALKSLLVRAKDWMDKIKKAPYNWIKERDALISEIDQLNK